MGRRALPKTKRQLDASRFLLLPAQIGESFCGEAIFGRIAPIEIEIGSGKGLFLSTASAACPDRDYVGVEIVGSYARFIADRLAADAASDASSNARSNARILLGDGQALLKKIAHDSIAAVHVYFPDPWWKKRHRKRRVLNREFVQSLDRVLIPQGRFHFWTDVKEYFESTLELMQEGSHLVGPYPVDSTPALHDMDYRTHFERRVRTNGLPVYRAEFFKSWQVQIAVGAIPGNLTAELEFAPTRSPGTPREAAAARETEATSKVSACREARVERQNEA